jgi:RNA recognition motif-containing protein
VLTTISIVEYATREQAQQAVNMLSNQSLMGRLVYVREVRESLEESHWMVLMEIVDRIVKPSLASPARQQVAVATSEAAPAEVVLWVAISEVPQCTVLQVAAAAKSISPTFVVPSLLEAA